MELSSKQKRHLRALAHHLNPVVYVGQGGVHEAVVAKARAELEAHELIKIKVLDGDTAADAAALAEACDAALVQVIGKVGVLYRRRKEEPTIVLPKG